MLTVTHKQLDFPHAIRSFIGFLEGTEKSAHTIKNYRLDLQAFRNYLAERQGGKSVKLWALTENDLQHYRVHLKTQGFKTNTRRRKLLTLQKFLNYLNRRNKLSPELARKIPTPHKIERVPVTHSSKDLLEAIQRLPAETIFEARNKALLWVLAETGCLVSEVTRLRFEDFSEAPAGPVLQIMGKLPRAVGITPELYTMIQSLKKGSSPSQQPYLFLGFNKYGSLGAPITPRGVELLVKAYASKIGQRRLTPRIFRHSAVLKWFQEGVASEEIQKRLGLKTSYAFRVFEPLLRKV